MAKIVCPECGLSAATWREEDIVMPCNWCLAGLTAPTKAKGDN